MRTMTLTLNLVLAVVLAAGISACGKKSGGKTAATPGSSCTYNYQLQQYTDAQGRYCNNYNGSSCQAQGLYYDSYTGQWRNASNQVVSCNDGGNWGQNGYFPYNGYYGSYGVQGCEGWSYIYGVSYIPVSVGYGQWVCANINWIGGYYSNIYNYYPQYYQQGYYYNPMYAWSQYDQGWGGGGGYGHCSNQIGIQFSNWNMGAGGYFCF